MSTYALPDEPSPSAWTHLAVNPIWPLFAVMFAGSWLAWPWAVFNGFVVGCPRRWSELGIGIVGFAVNIVYSITVIVLFGQEVIPEGWMPYLFISLSVWRLAVSYFLYDFQSQTFDLYEYTGGRVRSGLPILIIGFFARPLLMDLHPLVALILL